MSIKFDKKYGSWSLSLGKYEKEIKDTWYDNVVQYYVKNSGVHLKDRHIGLYEYGELNENGDWKTHYSEGHVTQEYVEPGYDEDEEYQYDLIVDGYFNIVKNKLMIKLSDCNGDSCKLILNIITS